MSQWADVLDALVDCEILVREVVAQGRSNEWAARTDREFTPIHWDSWLQRATAVIDRLDKRNG